MTAYSSYDNFYAHEQQQNMGRLRYPSIWGVLAIATILIASLDGAFAELPVNLVALYPPKVVASSLATLSDLKNVADGNTNTMFHSAYPNSVAFGSANDYTPYVGLELSQLSYITKIVIFNRPDFQSRLQNAEVRVGFNDIVSNSSVTTNPLVWKQNTPQGSVVEITLSAPVLGKWVSLQNFNSRSDANDAGSFVLNIMEIQVFGVPGRRQGYIQVFYLKPNNYSDF